MDEEQPRPVTVAVTRKSDGHACVINASDYDAALYILAGGTALMESPGGKPRGRPRKNLTTEATDGDR